MGRYLLRRILQMIPVVLGTTLLVYALVFALPGDPVKAMFGDKPVNEAVAAQIRAEYNLDKPFIVQYLLFLKNALTLDFGKTFSGQLVIDQIGRAFPVTIKLALMAFVFEAVFGVIFGAISGLKQGQVVRYRDSDYLSVAHLRTDLRHGLPCPVFLRREVASASSYGRCQSRIHRPADAGNSAWICVYGIYHQIESFGDFLQYRA